MKLIKTFQGIITELEEKISSLEEVQKSVGHHQKQLREANQQIDSIKVSEMFSLCAAGAEAVGSLQNNSTSVLF